MLSNSNQKLPIGEGSQNFEKKFENNNVFRPHQGAKVSKKPFFHQKMHVFLPTFFLYNYLTYMHHTVGKNSSNWREWCIMCWNMFIFGEVIAFLLLPVFRDVSRTLKSIKLDNFFVLWDISTCNMSLASVLDYHNDGNNGSLLCINFQLIIC